MEIEYIRDNYKFETFTEKHDLSNFEWTGYIERTDHYIKDLDNAGLLKIKEIEDWI